MNRTSFTELSAKRKAREIKKKEKIAHSLALTIIAKIKGFKSWEEYIKNIRKVNP